MESDIVCEKSISIGLMIIIIWIHEKKIILQIMAKNKQHSTNLRMALESYKNTDSADN